MSRRGRSSEVCADCGLPDPHWASVNRAVLICDQCCSVHRSLGRHSSQIRHLVRTSWPPTQLQMVQALYNNGSNAIWEQSLLDSASTTSGKRKASPQDKLHPNKAEFIRAKYQMLAFVHRAPCRDEDSCTAKDLSKQLHSSVRTGNLDTCLRLLSLGAQANFFHPEKGTTPLHVAAKAGQVSQVELLSVYGADPGAPDANGNTPIEYARQAGHLDLADRLVEIQYELTDRLAFYLCGRKPDHKNGQHFIIPQLADRNVSQDLTEVAKAAKRKLQSLSNHLFEELAMDVYDEVDRRETDAVWLTTQSHSTLMTEAVLVPFLPVNPEYSSTRNQGRQKLARFNAHEFATLIIDILSDAMRRQQGSSATIPKDELTLKRSSSRHASESQDADQHDYDSVASDEDTDIEAHSLKMGRAKSLDSDVSDGPVTVQEFLEVKNALTASEAKIQQLVKANVTLSEELRLLQKKLRSLQSENSSLRCQTSAEPPCQTPRAPETPNHAVPPPSFTLKSRPITMYETSLGLRPFLKAEMSQLEELPSLQPFLINLGQGAFTAPSLSASLPLSMSSSRTMYWPQMAELPPLSSSLPPSLLSSVSSSALQPSSGCCCHLVSKADKQSSDGDYDNTVHDSELEDSGLRVIGWGEEPDDLEAEPSLALPTTEDVIRKTEQITKNIQELLKAAQDSQQDSRLCEPRDSVRRLRHSLGCFSTLMPWAEKPPSPMQPFGLRGSGTSSNPKTPNNLVNPISPSNPASCFVSCAERIHMAVSDMLALFPKKPRSERVRGSLRSLKSNAHRLQVQCRKTSNPDSIFTQQVIQCAYDIAKAAKQLVTITTKENSI
ncbi:ARF GTPase-activating protein GIT2a isoform X2 [Pygocentrus nattereri]|uniref:ARF GTPase-activating protein GIT2a isoform X2 n=1 Tax=Pygocentrus nattereri TaxID=42514 RepID=UPI0008147994|nr:ARF GTPase-activating protein GIT2a isoform X2 [Pygocentrus nattereri]